VEQAVASALLAASTTFRPDQVRRYQQARGQEAEARAQWVLDKTLENAEAAERTCFPLCDDTGIPHIFLEIGDDAPLPAGFLNAVRRGVAAGLRALPGRPMAVLGDDVQRLTQSAGLSEDSDAVLPAPFQIRSIPGDQVRITVLMLGGGPEIRGKTQRVFHKHSIDVIVNEMVEWAKDGTLKLGCSPCTLAFGIGRTQVEAASLSLEAMKDADFDHQSALEQRITDEVNASGVGPLGLGGKTTVLGTFVKVGPQRASGIRVVSLRVGCCFDPRRARVTLRA
jgi:fumarate hydratase subunit alpha